MSPGAFGPQERVLKSIEMPWFALVAVSSASLGHGGERQVDGFTHPQRLKIFRWEDGVSAEASKLVGNPEKNSKTSEEEKSKQ